MNNTTQDECEELVREIAASEIYRYEAVGDDDGVTVCKMCDRKIDEDHEEDCIFLRALNLSKRLK